MTVSQTINPLSEFARLAAVATGTAAVLGLLAYWPVVRFSGDAAIGALAAGLAIALLGSFCGTLPPCLFANVGHRELATGTLAGLGLRFFATIALSLLGAALFADQKATLLITVGFAQFVFLAIDTAGLIRIVRKRSATDKE